MRNLFRLRSVATLIAVFSILVSPVVAPGGLPHTARGQEAPEATLDDSVNTYLPLIHYYRQRSWSVFGAETHDIDSRAGLMDQANMYWVRNSAISWAKIEPVRTDPPTYHWDQVDEAGLREAAAKSLTLIATIKDTPRWAQKVPGAFCGAIHSDNWDEFAQFVDAVVRRYSPRPYRVNFWELGNEPDASPQVLGWTSGNDLHSVFGCWGDESDAYYGGGYYAAALSVMYPVVKQADADAQVMTGGLLLDCDPTHPPPGKDCKPAKFLEGILRNNGAAYFDILAFHAFTNYNFPGIIDEVTGNWSARGGVFLGKINFINEVMTNYGVSKPLLLNESALVCPSWYRSRCTPPVSPDFLEKQAEYVSRLYVRTWANNLMGAIWYTVEESGWQSSGLSQSSGLKPAFYALQFTAHELSGATYTGVVSPGYADIEGYTFSAPGKRIWVLWSVDHVDRTISLPAQTIKVMDRYGATLSTPGGQLVVNGPVYIELTP